MYNTVQRETAAAEYETAAPTATRPDRHLPVSPWLVSVLILAAVVRIATLTGQSLWYDEGWSLYFSSGFSLQEVVLRLAQTPYAERLQPIYFVVLFAWRQLFGDSEIAVRSLSVFCGMMSVVLLFLVARRLGDQRRALWTALLAATSSYLVYHSQEARPYAMLTMLASAQLYCFIPVLRPEQPSGEKRWRWAFWALIGIGMLANVFMAIFAAALSVCQLFVDRDVRRWVKWWIPAAPFALPALIFYSWSPAGMDPNQVGVNRLLQPFIENAVFVPYGLVVGTSFGPPMELLRDADRWRVAFSYWPRLLMLLTAVVVLIAAIVGLLRRGSGTSAQDRQTMGFFLAVVLVSYLTALACAAATGINWQPRHAFFLFPPLAVVLAFPFLENSKLRGNYAHLRVAGCAAIIVLIALNAWSLSNSYWDDRYARDDYRSTAKYLQAKSDMPSILLWGLPDLLTYYGFHGTIDGTSFHTRDLVKSVRQATRDRDSVLIVLNRQFYWEILAGKPVENQLKPFYRKAETVRYPYFTIYRFERIH